MRAVKLVLLVAVGLALLSLSPIGSAADGRAPRRAELAWNEPAIVVVFRSEASAAAVRDVYRRHGLALVKRLPLLGLAERVVAPAGQQEATLAALRAEPVVRLAEEDAVIAVPRPRPAVVTTPLVAWAQRAVAPLATANDQFFRTQWAPPKIDLTSAWDVTTGRPEIKVAVADTGFYANHPDRPKNLVIGPDFSQSGGADTDGQGHGTHVAGIIAANANNGIGIAGVAPDVTIGIVKVLGNDGTGRVSDAASGIRWAADNGYRVINLSLGGPRPSQVQQEAIDYAYRKGVVVVAAAGNCGDGCQDGPPNYVSYPAAFDHVLAVGASTQSDTIADFSTHRPYVGISAPGQAISSLFSPTSPEASPDRCEPQTLLYCFLSGTSMASPHVAGLAALVLSVNPRLTPDQVMEILKRTAVNLGLSTEFQGSGRIDALAAVRAAKATLGQATPTPTPAGATPTATATPRAGGAPGTPPVGFVPVVRQDYDDPSLGGRWTSGIQVANLDASNAANVTLQLVRPDGSVAGQQTATIPASRSTTFFGPSLGAPAGFNGSAQIFADRLVAVITNELVTTTGGSAGSPSGAADSFSGVDAPMPAVYLPLVRTGFVAPGALAPTNSTLHVQNAGSAPATGVRVRFYAGGEAPVATRSLPSIPPGASVELNLRDVSGLGPSFTGTAIVTADQPLAVAVNLSDGREVLSYSNPGAGTTLNAPLVMRHNGGFDSEVFVQNVGASMARVTARATDSRTGQTLDLGPFTLTPGVGHVLTLDTSNRFVGSLVVQSSGAPLTGITVQRSATVGQVSGYALFTRASDHVVAPLVMFANAGWFTGVQVQNVGARDVPVTLRLNGKDVDTATLPAGQSRTWFPLPGLSGRFVGAGELVGPAGARLIGVVNQLNRQDAGDNFTTYAAPGVLDRVVVPTPPPQPSVTPFPTPPSAGPTPTPVRAPADFKIAGCSDAAQPPAANTRVGFAGLFLRSNGVPVPNARLYVAVNYVGSGITSYRGPFTDRSGFSGGFITIEEPLVEGAFLIAFDYLGTVYYRVFDFGEPTAFCPTLTPSSLGASSVDRATIQASAAGLRGVPPDVVRRAPRAMVALPR